MIVKLGKIISVINPRQKFEERLKLSVQTYLRRTWMTQTVYPGYWPSNVVLALYGNS